MDRVNLSPPNTNAKNAEVKRLSLKKRSLIFILPRECAMGRKLWCGQKEIRRYIYIYVRRAYMRVYMCSLSICLTFYIGSTRVFIYLTFFSAWNRTWRCHFRRETKGSCKVWTRKGGSTRRSNYYALRGALRLQQANTHASWWPWHPR